MRRPRSTALTAIFAVLASTLAFASASVVTAPAQAANINGAWSPVGTSALNGNVYVLAQEATGTGTVYAGGFFTNAGGNASGDYIASLDPSNSSADWQALTPTSLGVGSTYTGVYSIAPVAASDTVFIGGNFNASSSATSHIVSWDGSTTSNFAGLVNGGVETAATNPGDTGVEDIVAIDATTTYLAGYFRDAGNSTADNLVLYRNGAWTGPTGGVTADRPVNGIAYSDATTTAIGGQFTSAPAFPRVATWNCDSTSSACGTTNAVKSVAGDATTTAGFTSGTVAHLTYVQTDLYAGGNFITTNAASPVTVNGLAKWDGTAWGTVGDTSAGVGLGGTNAVVETIATSPGATTNTGYLYIGGSFTSINGVAANNVARLDLATNEWSSLGCGTYNGVSGGAVRGILPQVDSSVIIGGHFTSAGGRADNAYVTRYTPGADNCPTASSGGGSSPTAGTPSAPQNVTTSINADTGALTVTWDAPASDGGSALVQYQASTADGFVQCYTNPSTRSCTFTTADVPDRRKPVSEANAAQPESSWGLNLANQNAKTAYLQNQDYFGNTARVPWANGIFVRARNNVGWGALGWAPSKENQPVFTPGAPTNVVAAPGRNKVTVSWKAPADTGSYAITNYLAQATPSGKVCTTRQSDADMLSCTFDLPATNTRYSFSVQALNSAGWGDKSAASSAVSPYDFGMIEASRPNVLLGLGGTKVEASGAAPGLAGKAVTAAYKVGSQKDWTTQVNAATVNAQGKFSWSKKFGPSLNKQNVTLRFTYGADTVSGTYVLARGGQAGNLSEPRNIKVENVVNKVKVTWDPPKFDGGEKIIGYTMCAKGAGSLCRNVSADGQGVFQNLATGREYTITVAARTAARTGPEATAKQKVSPVEASVRISMRTGQAIKVEAEALGFKAGAKFRLEAAVVVFGRPADTWRWEELQSFTGNGRVKRGFSEDLGAYFDGETIAVRLVTPNGSVYSRVSRP